MRVCVIKCGRVADGLADVMPEYLDSFRALLAPHLPEATFEQVPAIDGELPDALDDYDVYILTGSPHGVYEDLPWIRAVEDFVRRAAAAGKVLIGGCFGHQLVVQALGGAVEKSDRGWGVGVHRHALTAREPWMNAGPAAVNVLVSHQDQVVRPPEGAVVLAASPFCPNAMLRIGDHILTLQGHPEMNVATVDRLIEMRRERIGEPVYATAKSSLSTPLDHDAMAAWIAGFIRRALSARQPAISAAVQAAGA